MKEIPKKTGILLIVVSFFALLYPLTARALDYPTRPIQFVVGTAPGDPADAMARILTDELTKEFKEAVVVQNRPGASGTLAASFVAAAKPDGYTIVAGMTMSHSVGFSLVPDISYKLSDFVPIARTTIFPLVVAVKNRMPPGKASMSLLRTQKSIQSTNPGRMAAAPL